MRKKSRSSSLDPVLSRGIVAILLSVLAILITLSFFGRAGAVGIMVDDYILSFLFGRIRYAVPIILPKASPRLCSPEFVHSQ